MKETLQQKVERMLNDLIARIAQLEKQENEYRQVGDYSSALDRRSKRQALEIVQTRIKEILKP